MGAGADVTSSRGAPFVGRTDEVRALAALLEIATSGVGQIALVEGDAGVGKSRLLAKVADRAREWGWQVLLSAAEELEGRRPFGVVADAFGLGDPTDPHRARVAGLLRAGPETVSPLVPSEAADVEFLVCEALLDLLEQLCTAGPVLVAVEDLHWADPSSLVALHRLARQLAPLPAVLVCTMRRHPRRSELDALAQSMAARGATHLALEPLDNNSVTALVAGLVGAPPGPNLVQQVVAAGGNPLFVTTLVDALHEEGAIAIAADGIAEIASVALPSSLWTTLLHRLSFLPASTLDVLGLAAVLGRYFSVRDLSTVAGRPVTALATALGEACRAGVLGDDGERMVFRHDLIREALYRDLPLSLRMGLHRDFASALAAAGAPKLAVADHLARGASPGDDQAIAWLHEAAREAAPKAPTVAVELLERALALAPESGERAARLGPDLALALIWAGRTAEGEERCRALLAGSLDPSVEVHLRLCYAQSLLLRARVGDALAQAWAVLDSSALSAADRARAQAWTSLPLVFLGDLEAAADLAEAALSAARQLHDAPAACQALETLSLVAYMRGRFDEALRRADESVAVAERARSREAFRALPHSARAITLMQLDRLDEAEQAAHSGRAFGEQFGMKATLPVFHFNAATAQFLAGRWDDALAEVEAGVALAEETGTGWTVHGRSLCALVAFHRGDLEAAEAAMAAAEREYADTGAPYGLSWMLLARARALEGSGCVEQANQVLGAAWNGCVAAEAVAEYSLLAADVVRLALAAGERPRAQEAATVAEAAAAATGLASLAAVALHCLGQVDADADGLAAAARAYRSSPRVLERAMAAEDAAAAMAHDGRREHARELLAEALELYTQLGAGHDACRAESRLRALGVRRGARGARARPKTGWGALTDTERRVADLVAQGLTNAEVARRLFISRHTVHTHVSHVLAKLGLSSRLQLAIGARELSGSVPP